MTVIMCPTMEDEEPYPSLGPFVCDFIEEMLCHGPGDLIGKPVDLNDEERAWVYRFYEIEPPFVETRKNGVISRSPNPRAGRRRFQRCALSLRKGSAKTEKAAWIAAAELHHEGPVRCAGFEKVHGVLTPIPMSVTDPYIAMISYAEEQTEELAYGALRRILEEMPIGNDFDIGLERIMRLDGKGKAEAVSASPNSRDGARTTFEHADEALALDTPIATPSGWTTMGSLHEGEIVFGRDGQPCRVIGKSPVHLSRSCYRVTFEDGTSLVADAQHLWFARRRGGCGHGQGCRCAISQGWAVRTTESMRDVKQKSGTRFTWTYHVPVGGPLITPPVPLPLDPYMFGLWLGDGEARNACFAVSDADCKEIAGNIESCGYRVTVNADRANARLYVTTLDSGDSVVGRLRALGVLGNKHVPHIYLHSGTEQRMALLQGLMDSDGHVSKRGDCTFINTNAALVSGVVQIARSLGFVPSVKWREDDRCATFRRVAKVAFQADRKAAPFRLSRKRDRLRPVRLARHMALAVVSVEPVDSEPVQCIAVDAPDRLYRAGHGLNVTHNTHRLVLQKHKRAWTVMLTNLNKRPLADPWALETTTAPAPGEGSVAENTMEYARAVITGRARNTRLFYYHREAGPEHDIDTREGLEAAIIEASGPYIAQWADVGAIAASFEEPGADRPYLERVWLNRSVQATGVAFDIKQWRSLARPGHVVPEGAAITLGFDGGRFDDATALIATEVETGFMWPLGIWEKPFAAVEWEVPVSEVDGVVSDAFERYNVTRMYCDPPKWESWVATWAGRYGVKRVVEWWTNRRKPMAYSLRSFIGAIATGEVTHDGSALFSEHIANARQQPTGLVDEEEKPLWILRKERPDSPKKIDAAVAANLSWEARNDSISAGEGAEEEAEIYFIGGTAPVARHSLTDGSTW